ncbi:MAG: twin-arginine translocation signal domain-containing protein [Anaerolineaceae bacterium]|nr:MAG: twin-arginine translocation signal domain-containing protein [Anaerolineaceae bacterium]
MNRRDFLKLSGLTAASLALTTLRPRALQSPTRKLNFVILLADTMTAANLSLYGYPRRTTPHLERLAGRAIVYHSHYSGGNYTTPGTASLLTGSLPWTHRAINLGGLVRRQLADRNIFHLLGSNYHRVGFAQNLWADLFLRQFRADLDTHIPSPTFIHGQEKPLVSQFFKNDELGAYYALDDFLLSTHHVVNPTAGSASMGYLGLFYGLSNRDIGTADAEHPYGLPSNGYYFFKNSVLYDGICDTILDLHRRENPFFAYFHLMAPHSTYRPTRQFVDTLVEMEFPTKQFHPLGGRTNRRTLLEQRKVYDEYVANVDAEMGRLFDSLDAAGVLEDTYFIITSDHGEFFERGEYGHDTPLLYNPVIHIPLLVFAPGQSQRVDVHTPTSSADVLPTLLSLAGKDVPNGEGRPLPGLGGSEDGARPIFSVEAKQVSSFIPLSRTSISMVKGTKKLIHYRGYEKYPDAFELYDLQTDDEEKRDLYAEDTVTAERMKEELFDHLADAEKTLKK